MKKIYLDMDGTIADLYTVKEWLPRLRNNDATIYFDARPLIEEEVLLNLMADGYEICIITWGSKTYDRKLYSATRYQKQKWLHRYFPNVKIAEFHLLKYGTPKSLYGNREFPLIDDEEQNRREWGATAFDPKDFWKE